MVDSLQDGGLFSPQVHTQRRFLRSHARATKGMHVTVNPSLIGLVHETSTYEVATAPAVGSICDSEDEPGTHGGIAASKDGMSTPVLTAKYSSAHDVAHMDS